MRNFIFTLFAITILSSAALAQEASVLSRAVTIDKQMKKSQVSLNNKASLHDTVYFFLQRLSSVDSAKYLNLSGNFKSFAQYFDCPQSMTIQGVHFYGVSYPAPSVTVTVELYNVTADSLPSGTAVATKTVTVDSSFNNGISIYAMFTTPVVRTAPYIIAVSYNSTTNPVYLISTNPKTHDGKGNWYSSFKYNTTWYRSKMLTLGGVAFDADFIFDPIVDYTIANPSFTLNPTCLSNPNTNVSFNLTRPAIYSSKMYNWWAYVDSVQNQFLWSYGDGASAFALNNSHVYATPAHYDIKLYYYFEAWSVYSAIDSVVNAIDLCVGMNENEGVAINIYPNPVLDLIKIDNAQNTELEIFDATGILVHRKRITAVNEIVDLSAFSKGIYVMKLSQGGGMLVRKIVKE